MSGRNYQELIVWQRAMLLVTAVYRATKMLPRDELYGLTSQMRRAAISVPSNIAEGQGLGSKMGFRRHLRIAHGSLRELETQFMITERLELLPKDEVAIALEMTAEIGRLLNGLINSLRL